MNWPGWNAALFEQAKTLWLSGKSAGEIQRIIGAPTRSTVIGKIHRAGLSGANRDGCIRAKDGRVMKIARAKLAPHRPKPPKLSKPAAMKSSPLPPDPAHTLHPIELTDLKPGHCRNPQWGHDEQPAIYLFCGATADEGSSYCSDCRDLLTVPGKVSLRNWLRGAVRQAARTG